MSYIIGIFTEFFSELVGFFKNLPENILTIAKSPMSILAIVGCVIILAMLVKVKKVNITSQMIARIGMALALCSIIGMIKIYHFPQGGSITPGRFVPIMLIAFMYGPEIGMFTGFVMGILDLFMDPYILSPIQVLFDYPLAFMMLGLSGFFHQKRYIGVIVGTLGRIICSTISGVAFFADYAPEGMNPLIYSLGVNVPVIGIEGLICLVLILVLPVDQIILQLNKHTNVRPQEALK